MSCHSSHHRHLKHTHTLYQIFFTFFVALLIDQGLVDSDDENCGLVLFSLNLSAIVVLASVALFQARRWQVTNTELKRNMDEHKSTISLAGSTMLPKDIDSFVPLSSMPKVAMKVADLATIAIAAEEAYAEAIETEALLKFVQDNIYDFQESSSKAPPGLRDMKKKVRRAKKKASGVLATLAKEIGLAQEVIKAAIDERCKAKNVIKLCDNARIATELAFAGVLRAMWTLIEHRSVESTWILAYYVRRRVN